MIGTVSISVGSGLPSVLRPFTIFKRTGLMDGTTSEGSAPGGLKASECLVYTSFSLLIGASILLGFGVKADQPVILCSVGALFLVGAFILIVVGLVRTLGKLSRKHQASDGDGDGSARGNDDAMRQAAQQRAWMNDVAVTNSSAMGFGLAQLNQSQLDNAARMMNEAEFIAYLYRQDLPPSYRASHKFASLSDYEYEECSDNGDSDIASPPPPAYDDVMSIQSAGYAHGNAPGHALLPAETRVQLESTASV